MITQRSFIPAAVLVLAAVAQPAAATRVTASHISARAAHPMQLQASLGSHILAAIRHILAGDDTIHRG